VFKLLESGRKDVLGVEITGGYKVEDVEAVKRAFEERQAATGGKVNLLVKLDGLELVESQLRALWDDAAYALRNKEHIGRVAIVGDSPAEKLLARLGGRLLGGRAGREERYFDVADLDRAWEFVNR
jgi:hypothetical protein